MSFEVGKINTKPQNMAELAVSLEHIKAALEDARANPNDPSKHEAFVKAAADIAEAKTALERHELEIKKANELAMDAARTAPRGDTRALKALPLIYTPEKDPDMRSMFGRNVAHFNLLMYAKDDLQGVDEDVVRRVERFRYLNAQLSVMHALNMGRKPEARERYIAAGGRKSLPFWSEWVELSREFHAAMDTAESGAGADWVPTGVNQVLIPDVRPEHMSRNMIQTYSMTRSPQMFPVQGAAFRAYLLGENTAVHASATVIGSRDSATASVTFTAKKLGALTDYSSELLEDSIVALATAVRADHQYANGESLESALWNGQLGTTGVGMGGSAATSSLFDTGVTFGATAGSVDDRAAWDGWRLLYASGACTTPGDASAGLVADLFTDQFGQMGRFGYNPADQFIGTSFVGAAKLLVLKDSSNQNVTLTSEKAGGSGTFQTGVLAQAFGRDVVASTQYPSTLNASGVVDGAGNKTAFHIVNRRRFGLGEVRLLNIEASDQVAFDTDQIVVKSTWRGQMKAYVTPSSTETSIGAIYGV